MGEPEALARGPDQSLQVRSGRAELPERVRKAIEEPAGKSARQLQTAPARGGAGIVYRGFVGTARAGRFAQAKYAAHVAGGRQNGPVRR